MPQASQKPTIKPKTRYIQLNRQSQDSCLMHEQMYTLEPFQIQPQTLSHEQVAQMISNWGAFNKIQEKFFVWEFSFQYQKILNIVPEQFYTTAIHYLFLKKLSLLVKDFNQNQVLTKSLQLKEIYKTQSLSGKLKGKRFDYLLLVTVKLISFFLGTHTHQIIINRQLQAEIYAILIYVLLGTQVSERTYSAIMQRYKLKPVVKFNGRPDIYKHSIILPNTSKHSSEHKQAAMKQSSKSKKRIGRTECKTGTALFHQLTPAQQEEKVTEMRELVKASLAVKQFVPKPKHKQTLDQVLARAKDIITQNQQLKQAKAIEKKDMKHKIINYTQMSCSLDLNRGNESLNVIHNHSLKIKPQKRSKYYRMVPKQHLRSASLNEELLPVKLPKIQKPKEQVYSYQAMVQKKKSGNYWKNIIGQMKENKFQNIEHFPPISANMYFRDQDQEQDKKNSRVSGATVDLVNREMNKQNNLQLMAQYEYLTERIVQTPKNPRDTTSQILTASKLPAPKKPTQHSKIKNSLVPVLQQIKNQINIIQYSNSTNIKQIYKDQKAFMNVYSSQPLDDINKKLKKKSFTHLKDIKKRFLKECQNRREKIQKSYFQ